MLVVAVVTTSLVVSAGRQAEARKGAEIPPAPEPATVELPKTPVAPPLEPPPVEPARDDRPRPVRVPRPGRGFGDEREVVRVAWNRAYARYLLAPVKAECGEFGWKAGEGLPDPAKVFPGDDVSYAVFVIVLDQMMRDDKDYALVKDESVLDAPLSAAPDAVTLRTLLVRFSYPKALGRKGAGSCVGIDLAALTAGLIKSLPDLPGLGSLPRDHTREVQQYPFPGAALPPPADPQPFTFPTVPPPTYGPSFPGGTLPNLPKGPFATPQPGQPGGPRR